jgi:hypothetical protein
LTPAVYPSEDVTISDVPTDSEYYQVVTRSSNYKWDMAMALANKLANFNIVVEKWDSSKIGGKRGGFNLRKAGRGQG